MPLGDKLPQRQRISFFPSVASKKLGLSERGWLLSYTRRAVDTGNIKAETQMRVNDLQKRESLYRLIKKLKGTCKRPSHHFTKK